MLIFKITGTHCMFRWISIFSVIYLFLERIEMVVVDVRVAQRVHKLSGGQTRDVRDHVREKGVAADGGEVEGKIFRVVFLLLCG